MCTNSTVGCGKSNLAYYDVDCRVAHSLHFNCFCTLKVYAMQFVTVNYMRLYIRIYGLNFNCIRYIESWTLSLMVYYVVLLISMLPMITGIGINTDSISPSLLENENIF